MGNIDFGSLTTRPQAEYFETSLHKLGSRAKEALREFWPKDGAGRTKKTTNGRGNSSMG